MRWDAQNARGRGCGTRPTATPHLKPPMTGCHPYHHHCLHRMRPDRSQPQRDAGPGGWWEWVKSHCEWGTRGYSRRNLTHLRVLRSSAPLLFPHKSLGGKSGRVRGAEFFSERKLATNEERRDSCHRSSDIPSHEFCFSAGGAQALSAACRAWQKRHGICNNAK